MVAEPRPRGRCIFERLDEDGEVRFAGTAYRDGVPLDRVSDRLETDASGNFLPAFPMTTGEGEPG